MGLTVPRQAEKLAVITLHGVLGQLVRGTSRLGDVHVPEFKTPSHPLAQSIGKAVQDEARHQTKPTGVFVAVLLTHTARR